MVVATAMMVMTDGAITIGIPVAGVDFEIGRFLRRDMNVGTVMIVVVEGFDQRDRRPVGDVSHGVLRLRHPMQVHRRQNGDGEQRAEGPSQCGHEASRAHLNTASPRIRQPVGSSPPSAGARVAAREMPFGEGFACSHRMMESLRRFPMVRFHPALLAVAAVVLSASPVIGHARLVSATPASGTTVAAPRSVSLTFSERFAAPFSTVEVEDGRGRAVTLTRTVSDDGKTLGGSFAAPLAAGTYRVTWAIAAADGHRMTGNYSFTVR